MRRLFNTIMALNTIISLLIISSCSSQKKVIVTGVPGTTIHKNNSYYEKIGTIGTDGKTKVKLDAEESFYLSKAPNSNNDYIPFAVNVKDKWNALDASAFAMIGSIAVTSWTLGLTGPLFFPKDKPLNTSTNNDLVTLKKEIKSKTDATSNTSSVRFYQVVVGDTLQSIATAHGVSVEQICSLNKINPTDQLQVGRLIKIQ